MAGTPLADASRADALDLVRTIAAARITMPQSVVRLSAGREHVTDEAQSLCFLAGANSTFVGFKLLTTVNPERSKDESLLARLGMRARRRVSRRSLLEPLVERLTGHLAPCSIAAGQGALS